MQYLPAFLSGTAFPCYKQDVLITRFRNINSACRTPFGDLLCRGMRIIRIKDTVDSLLCGKSAHVCRDVLDDTTLGQALSQLPF